MKLGAVLMAAGAGRRFGGNKLLYPVEGVPLIDRAMAALPAALFPLAAVVSRCPEILTRAAASGYLPVDNPGAGEGQSASVRLGLAALGGVDAALFAVCDQPFLTTESIMRLISAFQASPGCIHALSWQGRRGNPVIFPRICFPDLLALRGDTGGGAVIRARPDLLRLTEAASPAELRDVDWKSDL